MQWALEAPRRQEVQIGDDNLHFVYTHAYTKFPILLRDRRDTLETENLFFIIEVKNGELLRFKCVVYDDIGENDMFL